MKKYSSDKDALAVGEIIVTVVMFGFILGSIIVAALGAWWKILREPVYDVLPGVKMGEENRRATKDITLYGGSPGDKLLLLWDWGEEDGDVVEVDAPGWENRPVPLSSTPVAVPLQLPVEGMEVSIRCVSEGRVPGCTVGVSLKQFPISQESGAIRLLPGQIGKVTIKGGD
jgi:hypothetical protein